MFFRIAWRNIFRQKRRTLLTLLTMTGGFVLSSLSIGWMNGSYDSIILFFTDHRTGQVQIHGDGYLADPSIYTTISDYTTIGAMLDDMEDVRAWAPRIYVGALLATRPKGGNGVFSNSAGASVVAIDPTLESEATAFQDRITEGDMLSDSPSDTSLAATGRILLGEELALILDASPGDSLILLSQAANGAEADRKYIVAGIVSTGNPQVDRTTCYVTLSDAQTLFALENRIHELAVMSVSLGRVDALTARLSGMLEGAELEVDSWKTFAREFYNGMKADESQLKITIMIIVLVAAMGVLNTILMMVLERRREFGVMKALGTRPGFIIRMIVLEANIMAGFAVALGCVLSTIGLEILSKHGIVMDPPLEYGGTVMTEMVASTSPECYWIPAVCIIVTASLVSYMPALKAAHTRAAKALRTV